MASEPLALLRDVRDLAALANPDAPQAATQRAFDAARERSARHAHVPPARRIAEQFRMPWPEVLAVAYAPEHEQGKLLGIKDKEPNSKDWLSDEHVAAVLQLVASRLGADTVSIHEYESEYFGLVATDRARWLHGRQLLVPTAKQIVAAVGSWDDALRLAGLRAERERGPTRKHPNSPTLVDLMERFYAVHHVQPTARALKAFARGNGIPYPSVPRGNVFSNARREWIERRRARGETAPKRAPHGNRRSTAGRTTRTRSDFSRDVGAGRAGERRTDEWSREECVAAVARYLGQLAPGERSTSRGYRNWASSQEHAPVITTIQRCGGWEAVRRDALERIRHARSGAGS